MTALVKEHMHGEPPVVKLTAFCLADYATPEGDDIFPSIATLARHVGVTPRTVQRHMGRLIEIGFISRVGSAAGGRLPANASGHRPGRSNRYRINPNWWKSNHDKLSGLGDERVTSDAVTLTPVTANPDTAMSYKYSIEYSHTVDARESTCKPTNRIPPEAREKLNALSRSLRSFNNVAGRGAHGR